MYDFYLGLKFMLSYFTILPVRFKESDDLSSPAVLAAMLFWLPLGGLALGVLSLLVYRILFPLEWLAEVVTGVVYLMLYGFLHTEAIMDVADALYAKHSGKDPYAVIKEPTVGAMGTLWAGAVVLLKVATIVYLLSYEAYGLFLAALMISRLGLLLLFLTQRFRSTFITTMQERFEKRHFAASVVFFGIIGVLALGWLFVPLLLSGLLITYLTATLLGKKLGFLNGDVLGTTLETTEIILFLIGGMLWL